MGKLLNNRGFAITGILYTLFILFLFIMLSVLAGLRSRKNMLENSIQAVEESFTGSEKNSAANIILANQNKIAPVDGKYLFTLKRGDASYQCYSYLKKGDSLDMSTGEWELTFIPKDCNDYGIENVELVKIYSFEEEVVE